MILRSILATREGRVRWPWIAALFAVSIAAGWMLTTRLPYGESLGSGYLAAWTLAVSLAMILLIERRPAATLGLAWQSFSGRHCRWGLVLGGAMASMTILAAAALGYLEFEVPHHTSLGLISVLGPAFISFCLAALLEELLFRGYLFQIALERVPQSIALISFALLFAGAHWLNPHATTLGMANTFLAGLWFGGAYLRTRQLWLPLAMHVGWNFFLGTMWGADVSGLGTGQHLLIAHVSGPVWLTGGEYGMEGGALCTLVVLIGIVIVHLAPVFQIAPEQFAVWHRVLYFEDQIALEQQRTADHA